MTKLEFLSDAQSEMLAGGVYLGSNINTIGQANIGSATAVGGEAQSLLGFSSGSARAATFQGNNADIYNVIVSLF